MKALGTGHSRGVLWRDVEVVRRGGPPQLQLHGAAARRFEAMAAGLRGDDHPHRHTGDGAGDPDGRPMIPARRFLVDRWNPGAWRCAPRRSRRWPITSSRRVNSGCAVRPRRPTGPTIAATIGVEPRCLLRLNQVHGRQAVVVRGDDPAARDRLIAAASEDGQAGRPEADILVSDDPAVALAIQVADCVPLLMADRRSGAVAGVHAGWRGTVARAAAAAVEVLRNEFGTAPEDLAVAHGPSIGACCYEVGPD